MRKKIRIDQLGEGMYVCGLDRSWFHTPFLTHNFLIRDTGQIDKLRSSGVRHLFIDTGKGSDLVEDSPEPKEEREYVPIPWDTLVPGTTIPFSLFLDGPDGKECLIRRDGLYSVESAKLLSSGRRCYISFFEEKAYVDYRRKAESRPTEGALTAETFRRYSAVKELHYPVDRDFLMPGSEISFPLFLKESFVVTCCLQADDNRPVCIGEDGLPEGEIVIRQTDIPRYRSYLDEIIRRQKENIVVQTKITRENAKLTIRDFLESPRSGKIFDTTRDVVDRMIDIILQRNDTFIGLLTLNAHDFYTYAHSVNVAALAIALARALGLPQKDLFAVGIGGVLHDLGKSRVSHEVLNKTTRLTNEEFREIREHVSFGRTMLAEYTGIPAPALSFVVEHHELLNGKGYPAGLQAGEISIYGRMASILDVYDAITTERPYKKAYPPFYALQLIGEEKEKYDQSVFMEFVKVLGS